MADRFFTLAVCLLGCLLHAECKVFLDQDKASTVLRRYRRFNTGLLEEVLPGNLERECIEEVCDYEEAREVFEDDHKTRVFWIGYQDGNQCVSNPCMNRGKCQDKIGDYACCCPAGYEGKNCEIDNSCSSQNGGCKQICENDSAGKAICSCVAGYRLKEDQKTCEPTVPFPCGKITNPEAVKNMLTRSLERSSTNPTDGFQEKLGNAPLASSLDQAHLNMNSVNGEVPWQVYMISYERRGFCGGAVLNEKWVLTAAHCLEHEPHTIIAGEHNTGVYEHTEQPRRIVKAIPHPAYNTSNKYIHDIALLELDFPLLMSSYITPICIANKAFTDNLLMTGSGTVSGWWRMPGQQRSISILQLLEVHYADQSTCLRDTGDIAWPNLFCAGPSATSTKTHDGGPYTTNLEGTFFLTGIATCGEQCTGMGNYSLYTKIGNYVEWIKNMTTL